MPMLLSSSISSPASLHACLPLLASLLDSAWLARQKFVYAKEAVAGVVVNIGMLFGSFFKPPKLKASDGVVKVLTEMRLNSEDTARQMQGIDALLELTASPLKKVKQKGKNGKESVVSKIEVSPSAQEVIKFGGFEVLTSMLEQNEQNLYVCLKVLRTLMNLCALPVTKQWVLERGGESVAPIVASMSSALKVAKDSEDPTDAGNDAAADDASKSGKSRKSGDAGAKGKTSAGGPKGGVLEGEVQRYAMEVERVAAIVIGGLADSHPEIQTLVVDEGFVEAVVAAMEWFAKSEVLNIYCTVALLNISYGHQSNKVYIVRKRGLQTVITAMMQHKENANLQQQAIAFLFSCLRAEVSLCRPCPATRHFLVATDRTHVSHSPARWPLTHSPIKLAHCSPAYWRHSWVAPRLEWTLKLCGMPLSVRECAMLSRWRLKTTPPKKTFIPWRRRCSRLQRKTTVPAVEARRRPTLQGEILIYRQSRGLTG